jgi:hypothetical protein
MIYAGISIARRPTILDYRIAARAEALAKIVKAMEKAGIKFLPADSHGPGIRGKR